MNKKLIAIAVLAVLSTPAVAADSGLYLYGAAGQTKVDIDKGQLDADVRAVTGVNPSSSSVSDSDTGFTVQLGYRVNPNFAVEGGWFDLGKATYHATVSGVTFDEDVKASGLGISGVGILPIANKFSAFARLGMIDAKVEATATARAGTASASASESATKWTPMYGIGVMYDATEHMAIRGEFSKFSKVGDKDKTGEADVTMLSFGLMFRF